MSDYLPENYDANLAKSPEMEAAVKSGMAICSALPNAPKVSTVLMQAWCQLFAEEGMTPADVGRAFNDHLKNSKWFPAPAELIGFIRMERNLANMEFRRQAQVNRVQALPMRKLTREEIEAKQAELSELIQSMNDGPAKEMFLDIVEGREERRQARSVEQVSRHRWRIAETKDEAMSLDEQIRKLREA